MKLPPEINAKILSREQASEVLGQAKNSGKKLVFSNGCFDILHKGHLHVLYEAKKMGDILVVGLNSDRSVKALKGNSRPVKDEHTRAIILASLSMIDYVILFEEDTPSKLIELIVPHVLVKGGDYKTDEIAGADFILSNGGSVELIPFLEGHSSTALIERSKG